MDGIIRQSSSAIRWQRDRPGTMVRMTGPLSRRRFLRNTTAAAALAPAARGFSQQLAAAFQSAQTIAPGPFQPSWESLAQYTTPDWFRDAKFSTLR